MLWTRIRGILVRLSTTRVLVFLRETISLAFVEFAHGIQQQVGSRTKHGTLRSRRAIDKFVNALVGGVATPHDFRDGFVTEECARLCVDDFPAAKKNDAISFACVD